MASVSSTEMFFFFFPRFPPGYFKKFRITRFLLGTFITIVLVIAAWNLITGHTGGPAQSINIPVFVPKPVPHNLTEQNLPKFCQLVHDNPNGASAVQNAEYDRDCGSFDYDTQSYQQIIYSLDVQLMEGELSPTDATQTLPGDEPFPWCGVLQMATCPVPTDVAPIGPDDPALPYNQDVAEKSPDAWADFLATNNVELPDRSSVG